MTVTLAIFLGLIGLELYFGKRLGLKVYRFRDTASHLTIGLGQQITNFALMGFLAAGYAAIQSHLGILHFNEAAKVQWAAVIIIADFTYYFAHRLGHRVNLFIIPHSVHHQAKDYNYASALRLPWANRVIMFVFYVPLAILGIPPKMMVSALIANLLVGTFAHNGVIRRKLGLLEYVLVTPRTHFVHHGINGKYLDKNFGGVLIIWDRLFGTFQDLDEKVPVLLPGGESPDLLDPLEANLDYVRKVSFGMRHRSGLAKLRVLFETPERLEADLARYGYSPRIAATKPALPRDPIRIAVLFLVSTGLSLTLLSRGSTFSLAVQIGMAALVFTGGAIIGQLLSRRAPSVVSDQFSDSKVAA